MTTTRQIVVLAFVFAGAALTARAADAAANWSDKCAKCHGEDGKGDTKMGHKLGIADFTDPKAQAKFTDAQALDAMKSGLKDDKGKLRMKPVEGLSDDEMKALVPFVRALKK